LSSKYLKNRVTYPIGLLGGEIEIHFMHYKTEEEAREKWNKRVKRVPEADSELFFKFDDRDGCKREHLEAFHQLPFSNKLSFTSKPHLEFDNNIHVLTKSRELPDAVILFRKSVKYFSLKAWLDGKGVQLTVLGKVCKALDRFQRRLSQSEQTTVNS
jgi:uncharacterized protein (DUF1919 family)